MYQPPTRRLRSPNREVVNRPTVTTVRSPKLRTPRLRVERRAPFYGNLTQGCHRASEIDMESIPLQLYVLEAAA
jgi:hypothetical protein